MATGSGLPEYDLGGLGLVELRSGRGVGVAVADTHPFAVRDWVASAELAGQMWIVGAGSADAPEFGAWPDIEEPKVAFAVRDWPTRLGLVAAGLGIALVPGVAREAVPRGVHWIPVRDEGGGLRRQMWAVTIEGASAAATAMVEALADVVAELP